MSDRKTRITELLQSALAPTLLEVIDQSADHAGHSGARPEGGTHFHIVIKSDEFKGLSRVAAHRKVMSVLTGEFDTGLHALTLDTSHQ